MRILITGAGLVGAYTARELQARGHAVVLYSQAIDHAYLATVVDLARTQTVEGDVTDAAKLTETCQAHGVRALIHTAALIGAPVAREPMRGVAVNVMGSAAVAQAAHCAGVRRVVFCSSVAIYDLERLGANEAITEDSPAGPKNLYAATKVASEHILRQMAQLYDLELYLVRLAGVLGRGQYAGGSWMGRKLNRVLEAGLAGRTETFKPEWIGAQEYVYVKDAAQGLALAALTTSAPPGAYNIGLGRIHTFEDVIAEIRQALPGLNLLVEPAGPTETYLKRSQAFDLTRARAVLGYAPQFTFQTGLQDYLADLRAYAGQYARLD